MSAPVRLQFDDVEVRIDLARPLCVALEQHFDTRQPRHFDAPPAVSMPLRIGAFSGDVNSGASCNCRQVTLVPHCNGTHTESVGHLTGQAHDVAGVVPTELLPALLVSVTPVLATQTLEDSLPLPQEGDLLVTRAALSAAWPTGLPWQPRALLIRTLPNGIEKQGRNYAQARAPYLTRQAVNDLVIRGIEHLVLDVPSLDRDHDEGRLTGHRLFFGLAAGSQNLAEAHRAHCTITELAWFQPGLADGTYALQLQIPAFGGDAVPSRPILFALQAP
ncbi:MAG: cyclase family protein [Steroidobacteraceae bacterium]